MAGANTEQLLAIEHAGGVLLKAGAGSGKTFVLKEHMIYLSKKWLSEYKELQSKPDLSEFIKLKFSKTVLMTFTKKAAGEISIRLFDEFEKVIEQIDEVDRPLWEIICEQLDYLTITTIHGFCFKLIKQGFFPEVDVDNEMLSDSEFDDAVESIFETWINTNLKTEESDFVDVVLKEKNFILSSLKSILSDPTLRIMWEKIDLSKVTLQDSNDIILSISQLFKLDSVFGNRNIISSAAEYEGKKWYDALKVFCEQFESLETIDEMLAINEYFSKLKYKIPTSPRVNSTDADIYNVYQSFKELNAFMKSSGEDFELYSEFFETYVMNWFVKFKSLVDFASVQYREIPGITFSDLEYIVRKGLDDEQTVSRIAQSYSYLIVDEFQDTSYVQFEIIQKIIQHDFSRLFCVGDIKQAIYGFRGGELGVFLDCEKMTQTVRSLKNNYRSDKNIVEFNNNFFDFLFSKGLKYEGDDFRPVEVEYQENPIADRALGSIYEIEADIGFIKEFGLDKVGNSETEYLEALLLKKQIEIFRSNNEETCILYKKLKPSLLLIGLMIEQKVSFTAQIKVPLGEDPLCSIFKLLIENEYNTSENKERYLTLILSAYFALIDSSIEVDIGSLIKKFENDRLYLGLYQAFYNFVSVVNIANSNYKNNLLQIKNLCEIANESSEHLVTLLENSSSIAYSLDFQYGDNPRGILIMTAHASKGLQFSNVLLGGVYTNDKSFPFTGIFGKYPFSMKWSKEITSKKKFKTPQYILESEERKLKEFSESKRLFYVACTRAVNTLGWVDLEYGDVKKRTNSNSWKNGIDKWKSTLFKDNQKIINRFERKTYDISKEFSLKFLNLSSNRKPLFHVDSLGMTKKLGYVESRILPELSVTRLASVVSCPRKFYLKNICKISTEDLTLLGGNLTQVLKESDEELSSKSFSSSSERGTNLHLQLERTIKNGLSYPTDIDRKDKDAISWTVDKLQFFADNSTFLSEENIKFEFFNFMISGIPDLIILNDQIPQIWDFKTGQIKEDNSEIYYFQLMTYAYALYSLGKIAKNSEVKIVLCYLDEKKLVEKVHSFSDVDKYLRPFWLETSRPQNTNLNHCDSCEYGNICHK